LSIIILIGQLIRTKLENHANIKKQMSQPARQLIFDSAEWITSKRRVRRRSRPGGLFSLLFLGCSRRDPEHRKIIDQLWLQTWGRHRLSEVSLGHSQQSKFEAHADNKTDRADDTISFDENQQIDANGLHRPLDDGSPN
jgi:hypothetical protein